MIIFENLDSLHISAPSMSSAAEQSDSDTSTDKSADDTRNTDSTSPLSEIYSQEVMEELARMRVFVVGAGAIGCELLKNFALLGVGMGRSQNASPAACNHTGTHVGVIDSTSSSAGSSSAGSSSGSTGSLWDMISSGSVEGGRKGEGRGRGGIVLTDMDSIERSNLNRQLLFRQRHVGTAKSSTAAEMITYINPRLRGRVLALTEKLGDGHHSAEDEWLFDDDDNDDDDDVDDENEEGTDSDSSNTPYPNAEHGAFSDAFWSHCDVVVRVLTC